MKKEGNISEDEYNTLYTRGSCYATLYGLPKVHKENTPLRPVMAAFNTPSYKLSKFIGKSLSHLTVNEFTLRNSYEMAEYLKDISYTENHVFTSFDITSLYTNIPLKETLALTCDKMYTNEGSFHNMTKKEFSKLLDTCCNNNYFIFNGKLFKQIDGVAMGSPLSATLANVFLTHHEKLWLDECPPEFKPIIYKRYVDDTFVVFRHKDHIPLFFSYINSKHPNIKFTKEEESENKLPFLDILIKKNDDNQLTTGLYRKPTFTGLGLKFISHCCMKFKINSITTMIHGAYALLSNYHEFDREIRFLKDFY